MPEQQLSSQDAQYVATYDIPLVSNQRMLSTQDPQFAQSRTQEPIQSDEPDSRTEDDEAENGDCSQEGFEEEEGINGLSSQYLDDMQRNGRGLQSLSDSLASISSNRNSLVPFVSANVSC